MCNKILSWFNKKEQETRVLDDSEQEIAVKTIHSRIKMSYVFLTVVSAITYFVFQMLTHLFSEYNLAQNNIQSIQLITWFLFAFIACIINVFAALQTIATDSIFMQPLVKFQEAQVKHANNIYVSLSNTAKYSIVILIAIFIFIIFAGEHIIINDDILLIVFVFGLITSFCTNNILFKRFLVWLSLSMFALFAFYNACGIVYEPNETVQNVMQSIDIPKILSIFGAIAIVVIGCVQIAIIDQIKRLKQHICQKEEKSGDKINRREKLKMEPDKCNELEAEKDIFYKWYTDNANQRFFEKDFFLKMIIKQKRLKVNEYINAYNSYKQKLANHPKELLMEAKFYLNKNNDWDDAMHFALSSVVGALTGTWMSNEIPNNDWSISYLIIIAILFLACLFIYQPDGTQMKIFRLAVIEDRINELSSNDENSYSNRNNNDCGISYTGELHHDVDIRS